MSLTHNDTVKLLAYLTHHDQRTVGQEDVHAWQDASEYGRWTLDEAKAAVRQLANDPDVRRVQPALVTQVIRARRQDAAMRQETSERVERNAALAGPLARALERGSGVGDARHVGADHMDHIYAARDWSPTQRAATQHTCPWCRAQPGVRCTRPSPRVESGRTDMAESHPSRVALIVACTAKDCGAAVGEPCADGHPHHVRDQAAIGEAGQMRRREAAARATSTTSSPLVESASSG